MNAIPSLDHPTFDDGYFGDSKTVVLGVTIGDGTTWIPATGESTDGRRLRRVPTRRLYAFAWQNDHDPDAFYGT